MRSATAFEPVSSLIPDDDKYKTVVVYDTAPEYTDVRISDLNGQYVLLALWAAATPPKLDKITADELMKKPFSIGRISDNMIKLKMNEKLDWWNGNGDFWVVFVLPSADGKKVTSGYLSKEPHSFTKPVTYIGNKDIMPPARLDLDLSGSLPF